MPTWPPLPCGKWLGSIGYLAREPRSGLRSKRRPDGAAQFARECVADLLDRLDEMVAGRRSSW